MRRKITKNIIAVILALIICCTLIYFGHYRLAPIVSFLPVLVAGIYNGRLKNKKE